MRRFLLTIVPVLMLAVGIPLSAPAPALQVNLGDCPNNATHLRGTQRQYECRCRARATRSGTVWGTNTYTDDSRICRAAVHDGVIRNGGGRVRFETLPGLSSYQGSGRNGVRTSNFGSWSGSFRFLGGGGGAQINDCPTNATSLRGTNQILRCQCSANASRSGTVWGTNVYTDDSRICRAAVHAGEISNRGGTVWVRTRPGQNSYFGSRRNGVASRNYGRWSGSFDFDRRNTGGQTPIPPGGNTGGNTGSNVQNCPGNGYGLRTVSSSLTCRCTRTGVSAGQIWGTGRYSERSAICRAAFHAGVVGRNGGVITVYPTGPRVLFRGSTQNGVSSDTAGPDSRSFRFN
jgi:hypothetical protein